MIVEPEVLELQERLGGIGAEPSEWECPICSADYGPSDSHPWHWPDEDCRAVREPVV